MKRALPLLLPLLLAACGTNDAPTVPDIIKPTVTLSQVPTTLAQAGEVEVGATAQDNVAVREVRFYVNDVLVSADTAAPYSAKLSLAAGTSTIKVVAVDTSGNESAPATQTVTVSSVDTELPNLDFKGPTSVRTTAPVEFSVVASDNVGVSSVAVYEGNQLLQTFTQTPAVLSRSFTAADNGNHTYRAVATDLAGNRIEHSLTFTVSISSNPSDTEKPVLTLDVPATAITTAGTYTLGFSATDNVGVERLEIQLISQTALGTQTIPFPTVYSSSGSIPLPVTRELNGTYNLIVTAYDAAGNSSRQQAIVTVAIP